MDQTLTVGYATAPLPADEAARLASLRDLAILDTPAERVFDALARLAAELCGTPIGRLSLVDAERQWFKAQHGVEGPRQTPRDHALCAHAIVQDGIFEVPDARLDPRFAGNPLVVAAAGVVFYAAAPVLGGDGHRVGTLCVIDRQPRRLEPRQRALLAHLGGVASALLLDRRDALRRAATEQERARVTLHAIGDGVITTDERGRIEVFNPVAERLTGWSAEEARGRPIDEVFHVINEVTREPGAHPVKAVLSGAEAGEPAPAPTLVARDGSEYGIEDSAAPIRDAAGRLIGAVLVFRDVTERRRMTREISRRAMYDPLTGLVNRAEFDHRLRRVLESARGATAGHALLYIDLDQFKLVNDACGHTVGDQLLQQVAGLLQAGVRARDTLARLGGDEFAVILEHCSAEQAQRVAQTLCDTIDEYRFVHDRRRFRVGASIGLVPVDDRWPTAAAVLQAADAACYAAKEAGRNRVHVYTDPEGRVQARRGEMRWASRLQQAIEDDGFALVCQAIVPLRPRAEGLHCEVLLRLLDQGGQMVMPGAFMPAAERYQLATRVDRWVIKALLEWMARFRGALAGIETLAVNLSGQSIGDRAFLAYTSDLMNRIPADTRKLCFEITETAAISNLRDARRFIETMRVHGCRFALDDFGSGVSSFAYLKSLPVDYLKIDGQFVRDLVEDPVDRATVRCIQEVAQVVGKRTIAECVESAEACDLLRTMGIDYAQGYAVQRPMPIDELVGFRPRWLQQLRAS